MGSEEPEVQEIAADRIVLDLHGSKHGAQGMEHGTWERASGVGRQ